MNKFLTLIICILLTAGPALGAAPSNMLKSGILQYKSGNYVGCSQTMKKITTSDPGNIIAHYYLAISYVKIDQKEEAIKEYNAVLALDPNSVLAYYSKIGLQYLGSEVPATPQGQPGSVIPPQGVSSFIPLTEASNYMSNKAKDALIDKNLNNIIDNVNKNGSVDTEKIKRIEGYSKRSDNSGADDNNVPNKEQVAQALETLQKAGLTPNAANPYQNLNPEVLQMQMLMSSMGGGNSNNNSMNMMPLLMLSQNSNSSTKMDPQLIENMVTGMMMPNMFSLNNNNNND